MKETKSFFSLSILITSKNLYEYQIFSYELFLCWPETEQKLLLIWKIALSKTNLAIKTKRKEWIQSVNISFYDCSIDYELVGDQTGSSLRSTNRMTLLNKQALVLFFFFLKDDFNAAILGRILSHVKTRKD